MCFILSWEYRVVNCCFSLGGREGEGGREGHLRPLSRRDTSHFALAKN